MSLINEALKKAQRQRNDDPIESTPLPGGRIAPRKQARSAQSIFLIAAGAVVLVVLSVGLTVYLVYRPSPAAPSVATGAADASAVTPSTVPVTTSGAASTIVTAPEATVAPASLPPGTSPTTVASIPPPNTSPIKSPEFRPQSGATPARSAVSPPASNAPTVATVPVPSPAPSESPAPAAAQQTMPAVNVPTDPRIHAFVDAIRITGVKAAGTDSRVLMNERVYRLNDLVERTLGVRLMKVESDSLTFSDANGAIYQKYF